MLKHLPIDARENQEFVAVLECLDRGIDMNDIRHLRLFEFVRGDQPRLMLRIFVNRSEQRVDLVSRVTGLEVTSSNERVQKRPSPLVAGFWMIWLLLSLYVFFCG